MSQSKPIPKPKDYDNRRRWQDAARARGEVPECGREACRNPAEPAWVNAHTPLLYCGNCASKINQFAKADGREPLCTPEATQAGLKSIKA